FDLLDSQKGRVITLTITGTVSNNVVPGQQYVNTDTVRWTSLPGAPTIPSDNPDASERTGSGTPAVNDYVTSDSATFIVAAPTINKELLNTSIINGNNDLSEAVIGELVEYRVNVNVPDGNLPSAQVVDQLPAGLAFVRLVSFTDNDPTHLTFTGDPTAPSVTN